MTTAHWDRGLQPERTNLAWRRTALGITAGLALAARIVGASHPVLGVALPAAGIAAGAILLAAADRRSARLQRWLRGRSHTAPGGRLLFTAAVLAVVFGAVGTYLVITGYGPADR